MTTILDTGIYLLDRLPAFGAILLLLVAARFLFIAVTPFKAVNGVLNQENVATAIVFAAFLFAVAIAIAGATFGLEQEESIAGAGMVLVEGLLTIVLLRISIWVNDRFILYRFCITKEILEDINLGKVEPDEQALLEDLGKHVGLKGTDINLLIDKKRAARRRESQSTVA